MSEDQEMNGLELEAIKVNGSPINTWNKINIDDDKVILFWKHIYKPEEKCEGIDFYCVSWVSRSISPPGPDKYERLLEGRGFFDGIRHLYFGADHEEGYFNYPKVELLLKVLEAVKKLEDEQLPRHEDF